MYERVLVATDGSDPATRAVDAALDLAATFDAELYTVSVVDTRRYGPSALSGSESIVNELEARASELLEDVKTRADVDVTTERRRGRPEVEIADYADAIEADVIVLGNRGRGGGDGNGGEIGSTAERVVRSVDRPVLTM